MNPKSAYLYAIHALGILMVIYCLLMIYTLVPLIGDDGLRPHLVSCICMACYGLSGIYILINRKKSIITCVALVLLVHAVTTGLSNSMLLNSYDDVEFTKAMLNLIVASLDLVLLLLYLIGFRRSSRRLILLLAAQAYVMFLELLVEFHSTRVIIGTIVSEFSLIFYIIVNSLLIFLLGNRSVSDLPIKRSSRYNSERLYTSMCCGTIITISEEDYNLLSSDDRSTWNQSMDPDVEAEISLPALDRYGKYGIIVQKRHGSENLRMVFHDAISVGYLNTVTIDVMHVVEMESEYDCRKVRFYGKEGMFIDLLVGDFDAVLRASQSF